MHHHSDLYNTDFNAWTQEQAALLRDRKTPALDYDNLAEEIESLGKSQHRELARRLDVLVMHLLKWRSQPSEHAGSWGRPSLAPHPRAGHGRNRCLEGNHDAWSIGLYSLAAHLLGVPWSTSLHPPFDAMPADVLALLKWMTVAYESAPSSTAITHYINDVDLALLKKCGLRRLQPGDIGRAALVHFALRRTVAERIESQVRATWSVNRKTQDAVVIVEQLCRRFPLFARQLQQRRRDVREPGRKERGKRATIEMLDEYDIQDALHAILKLYFDDVQKEVWTPSYAGSQNRIDFVLKREKIIIETKFMGVRLTQGEVTRQLTIDEKYYRQYPDCQTLICFVYDPEYRCDNPTALEGDINLDEGDFRVRVIVSPRGI